MKSKHAHTKCTIQCCKNVLSNLVPTYLQKRHLTIYEYKHILISSDVYMCLIYLWRNKPNRSAGRHSGRWLWLYINTCELVNEYSNSITSIEHFNAKCNTNELYISIMSTYVWHSIRGCVCRPVKVSALVVQSGGLHIKFECKFEIFREPLTLEPINYDITCQGVRGSPTASHGAFPPIQRIYLSPRVSGYRSKPCSAV